MEVLGLLPISSFNAVSARSMRGILFYPLPLAIAIISPAETSDYQYRAIHIYEDAQAHLESIASNIINVPGQPANTIDSNDIDGDLILNADDVDDDNDGLIEIHSVRDLNRMRYQLDGRGYKESDTAELITRGCRGQRLHRLRTNKRFKFNQCPLECGRSSTFLLESFSGLAAHRH